MDEDARILRATLASEKLHRSAKGCRSCRQRTHHVDAEGEPLCALCIVDRMPKRAADAGWRTNNWKEEEE